MIKITLEANKNGVVSRLEADYNTYEELDRDRNMLVNCVNFAFNDLSNKTGTVMPGKDKNAFKPKIKERVDGPMTDAQYNYILKLGYVFQTQDELDGMTYSSANELIRALKQ